MENLIISLLASVSVGVYLKIAKQKGIYIYSMLVFNYLVTVGLSWFLFDIAQVDFSQDGLPIPLIIALGILLPIVFVFQMLSIKYVGIVKTDISQRLSLFIPLLASVYLFAEVYSGLKIVGFLIAFMAIFFTLSKSGHTKTEQKEPSLGWMYPLLMLIGFGVIDILFKMVALQKSGAYPYPSILFLVFVGALFVALLIKGYLILTKKQTLTLQNMLWGLGLGGLNFTNIYFYLKAHQSFSENPSTVFATMNLGVILLGSLIGIIVFEERFSPKNYFGLFLALVAIVVITIAQVFGF